jgi:hypothetical protein
VTPEPTSDFAFARKAGSALWSIYLLLGMHVFMHHVGGSGLYIPVNAIAWIFASATIGIGLWEAARSR